MDTPRQSHKKIYIFYFFTGKKKKQRIENLTPLGSFASRTSQKGWIPTVHQDTSELNEKKKLCDANFFFFFISFLFRVDIEIEKKKKKKKKKRKWKKIARGV
jgi:hypothetical protein